MCRPWRKSSTVAVGHRNARCPNTFKVALLGRIPRNQSGWRTTVSALLAFQGRSTPGTSGTAGVSPATSNSKRPNGSAAHTGRPRRPHLYRRRRDRSAGGEPQPPAPTTTGATTTGSTAQQQVQERLKGNHQRITGLLFRDRQLVVQGGRFRLDDFVKGSEYSNMSSVASGQASGRTPARH